MSTGPVLDLDALLAPVSESAPAGVDLREDTSPQSVYYQLKDFRATARAAERRSDSGEDAETGQIEWKKILDLSQRALASQSKDLEVACWLLEGLVRSHGFAGLRDGVALISGLFEQYGDQLHSLQDEEGLETFLAPLTGLNGVEGEGTLIQPLRKIPLTTGDDESFAAFHYTQAVDLTKLTDADARERRIAAGVPTVEKFETALRSSPKDFLRNLLGDLREAQAKLEKLSDVLAEKYGADAPPTSRLRDTLETIYDLVHSRTRDLLPPEPSAVEASGETAGNGADHSDAAGSGQPGRPGISAPGAINNREDALRALQKISDFFKVTEPHSTIAFTLDDVIRRARMTLPELLAELLPDEAARRTFLMSAGIRPPEA
jgi:type VI secretion system protein ImpA